MVVSWEGSSGCFSVPSTAHGTLCSSGSDAFPTDVGTKQESRTGMEQVYTMACHARDPARV